MLQEAVPSTVVKPTVADWVVAPVLVTVKVKEVVPPVLPSFWITSSIVSVAVSSFTIVVVGVYFVMVAMLAPLSLTVKVSVSSTVVSAQTGTVMVLIVSLGAKVSVPAWLMWPEVTVAPVPQLLLPVAVPSTVVKPTVADWVVAPVLVTVKVKEVVPPVLHRKSTRLTSSHVAISYAAFVLVKVSFVMVAPVAPLSLTV